MPLLPTLDADGRPTPTTLFLAIHHALRRDAHRFPGALRAAGGDPARLAAVARHWHGYEAILVEHHEHEDALAFPHVLSVEPALAGVVERLASDHAGLDGLLAELDAAYTALPAGVEACAGLAARLAAVLDDHLDLEEEHLVPVLERNPAAAPPPGPGPQNPEFLVPWLADGLAPEVVAALLAGLPEDWQAAFPGWDAAYRATPVHSAA